MNRPIYCRTSGLPLNECRCYRCKQPVSQESKK